MPRRLASATSAASSARGTTAPVGLAGLANSSPRSFFAHAPPPDARHEIGGLLQLDLDDVEAERRHDVAIGRIAGRGDGDRVAGIEHRQKRQVEGGRRAGGDRNPLRRDIDPVMVAIVARRSPRAGPACQARRYSRCGRSPAPSPPLHGPRPAPGRKAGPTAIEMTGMRPAPSAGLPRQECPWRETARHRRAGRSIPFRPSPSVRVAAHPTPHKCPNDMGITSS